MQNNENNQKEEGDQTERKTKDIQSNSIAKKGVSRFTVPGSRPLKETANLKSYLLKYLV